VSPTTLEWGDGPADPRVAEQHVQPAEPVHGLSHCVDDLAFVGHVGDAIGRRVRPELGDRLGQPPGVEPGEMDPGPLGREQPGGGQADAALAAGDEGDLVV